MFQLKERVIMCVPTAAHCRMVCLFWFVFEVWLKVHQISNAIQLQQRSYAVDGLLASTAIRRARSTEAPTVKIKVRMSQAPRRPISNRNMRLERVGMSTVLNNNRGIALSN